jgi:multicomponent Na+:H+ antiporter subunit D
MLLAMGISAVLCILIGSFPQYLYSLLPYATDYQPYTVSHVLAQTQLLFFSALAFTLLLLAGIYPPEIRSINVDADWVYRKGCRQIYRFCAWAFDGINEWANRTFAQQFPKLLAAFFEEPGGNLQKYGYRLWVETSGLDGDHEKIARSIDGRSRSAAYPIGAGVLLAVLILALVSLVLYLR